MRPGRKLKMGIQQKVRWNSPIKNCCARFHSSTRQALQMTNLALGLALNIQIIMKQRTGQFEIDTALLYSDLDEEIYMRIPDGYVRYMKEVHKKIIDPSTHVLLL
jgi:hypothetical protein